MPFTRFLLLILLTFSSKTVAGEPNLGPSAALLRKLPGAHSVTSHRKTDRPTTCVIHVLDHHFISRDRFAAEIRSTAKDSVSDEEIDNQFEQFMDEVEAVQAEQIELLRILISHHDVNWIALEGLTDKNNAEFKRHVASLRKFKPYDDDNSPIQELLRRMHRRDVMEIGAVGQLFMSGELEEIFPPEDADAFQAAHDEEESGVDIGKSDEPRENAIVRNAMKRGPVAVLVMGGAHDLSDNVPDGVEYIRVTTKRYHAVALEESD